MLEEKSLGQPREATACHRVYRRRDLSFHFRDYIIILVLIFLVCCANALVEVLASLKF